MLNNTKVLGIFLSTTLMCVTTASAVEVGAFLVKIDGRYSISQSHNGLVPSLTTNGTNITAKSLKNKNLNGYGIGAGFGYVASDNIITDVTFAYNNSKTKTDSTNLAITKVDDNTLSAMLNGQYRFNLHNRISPYIMAGMGMNMVKTKLTLPTTGMVINSVTINDSAATPAPLTLNSLSSKNTTYLAYQGGFGLNLETIQSVSIDLGYRISNHQNGKFKAFSSDISFKPKTTFQQTVVMSLNIAL